MTKFFSESKEIYESDDLLYIYLINLFTQIFDTLQNAVQGELRGLEILDILSYSTFVIFLIFMPSMTYILAFIFGWDVIGVITSEMLSYFSMFVVLTYWLWYKVDLYKLCNPETLKEDNELKIEMKEIE